MSAMVHHRLWPLLTAFVLLLAGALLLESFAERRGKEPLVIAVRGEVDSGDTAQPSTSAEAPPEVLRAREMARRGEVEAARQLLSSVLASRPEDPAVHAELGFWALADGDTKQAVQHLERAHAAAPHEAWIAYNLGVARDRLEDRAGAKLAYRAALAAREEYSPARIALASLLRQDGAIDEAITVITPATQHGNEEEVARAWAGLGRLRLAKGERELAEESFTLAIERAPALVDVRLLIARAYGDAGTSEANKKALEQLRIAVTLSPDTAEVHTALGRALERAGDATAAESAYEQALRLSPEQTLARRRLLRLELDRRDFEAAAAHAQKLLAAGPNEPEHHFLVGLVAARQGNRDEARLAYGAAIQKAGGTYPEAYFNLGVLEKADGKLDAAMSAYRTALAQRPDYLAAMNNLGLTLSAAGREAEASIVFRRALDKDPTYAPGWLNLGDLLLAQRRYEEAVKAFERAIAARPNYQQAQLNLAITLARAGKKQEAVAAYNRILAEHPRYVAAWFNLGLTYEEIGQPKDAEHAYQQALAVEPTHAGSMRRLAKLVAEAGDPAAATRILEELLDLEPSDRAARLTLAEIRLQQGDRAACRRDAALVLASNPNDVKGMRLAAACAAAEARR